MLLFATTERTVTLIKAFWGLPCTGHIGNSHYLDSCDSQGCHWPVTPNSTAGFEVVLRNNTLGNFALQSHIMDLFWLDGAIQKTTSDTCPSGIVDTETLIQWLNVNVKHEKDFRCHFWVTFIYCGIHKQSAGFIHTLLLKYSVNQCAYSAWIMRNINLCPVYARWTQNST